MCIITKAKRRLGGKPEVPEEEPRYPVVIVEEESEEMVNYFKAVSQLRFSRLV